MSKFSDDIIREELVCEDDNFVTPEEYKNMSIEELRLAKEKLLSQMRATTHEEIQSVEEYIGSISDSTGINFNNFYDNFDTPSVCNNCSNNPKNGGSGICNCILGQEVLY